MKQNANTNHIPETQADQAHEAAEAVAAIDAECPATPPELFNDGNESEVRSVYRAAYIAHVRGEHWREQGLPTDEAIKRAAREAADHVNGSLLVRRVQARQAHEDAQGVDLAAYRARLETDEVVRDHAAEIAERLRVSALETEGAEKSPAVVRALARGDCSSALDYAAITRVRETLGVEAGEDLADVAPSVAEAFETQPFPAVVAEAERVAAA